MSKYSVIIIGAGVSGLAAAARLLNNGVDDILLLEAQGRIGGRAFTIDSGHDEQFLELGCMWIHGEGDNPVFQLCDKLNFIDRNNITNIRGNDYQMCTQDGFRVDDKPEYSSIYEEIFEMFDSIGDLGLDTDKPLETVLYEQFEKLLDKLHVENRLVGIDMSVVRAMFLNEYKLKSSEMGCEDLNEHSTIGLQNYEYFMGNFMVNLRKGYGELVEYFASKIPSNRLKLHQAVQKIQYSNANDGVTVRTFNEFTNTETIYYCDQVLCTMSLGCLKATHDSLFEPGLPRRKVNAIENLGFGFVNKIFIFFDEPIFQSDSELRVLNILWRDDFDFQLESIEKWGLQNKTFYKAITMFILHQKIPNLISTFLTGEDAIYIETLEPQCLIEVLHELITKCFTAITFPKAKHLIRSEWFTNKYTLGSYSYPKFGSTRQDFEALAKSVDFKLHFSGEATHYAYYGTVHSAYASGLRAADEIKKCLTDVIRI